MSAHHITNLDIVVNKPMMCLLSCC